MTGEGIRGERTALRPATDSDVELLFTWLQDPDVYRWWGGEPVGRETVALKYAGGRRPEVDSFIVEEGSQPVGYIQSWVADGKGGLDMFLVPSARGRGLGPDAARALTRELLISRGWLRVTVDPAASNQYAVRAWHHAGFRFRFERELPDAPGGPGLLMVYRPGRIHIIGGPGTGKTTLARHISRTVGAPAHDLDVVAYEHGAGAKRSLASRRSDARRIAQAPGWVTEGIYLWWCAPLADVADRIVWLDVPWRVAVYRIVRRHIMLSLAGRNPHPGLEKLVRFAWGTRRYYLAERTYAPVDENDDGAITRAATAVWLRQYANKVTRCRSTGDLTGLMSVVGASRP